MTNAEKLLEIGLICPCGGEIEVTKSDTPAYWWAGCVNCRTQLYHTTSQIDALAAWLVLTGGPVPGCVKPPEPKWEREFWVRGSKTTSWSSETWPNLAGSDYSLRWGERNLETITEWLEAEYAE